MSIKTWEQETEQEWGDLRRHLASWLRGCQGEQTLVIELAWPDGELSGAAPYVQVCIDDSFAHAEAASNRRLDERFRLDKPRRKAMREQGWQRPSEDVPNYWRDVDVSEEADDLAWLVVTTLRGVYGVVAPAFLTIGGFGPDSNLAQQQTPLGLRRRVALERTLDLTAVKVEGPDHLRDLVAAALEPLVAGEVKFDADGDIPVPAGGTVLYLRVEEDAPAVRLFTWLLHDVKWTPRVGYELNELNKRINVARVVHHDGYVMVNTQLMCVPFVPETLRHEVLGMSMFLDGLDTRIQQRVGELRMTETADGEAT